MFNDSQKIDILISEFFSSESFNIKIIPENLPKRFIIFSPVVFIYIFFQTSLALKKTCKFASRFT